jgi:DNA-binding transcriptional LysR family regulator
MPLRHATLRQLRVFEAAARHLSFARAAEELHLSQPAVSMQLKDLEASAGLPLFERVRRKLALTAAGMLVLDHARAMLRAVEDAEESLDGLKGLERGRVAIAVASTAKYFAPRLLARFRERHPGVELALTVANRDLVAEALAGNAVDIAIMGRPPPGLAAIAEPFARHPLVVIAAPGHELAKRRRLPVEALAPHPFIVRERGSGTRSSMEAFFDEHGVRVAVAMEMASNETIKQAVMAGMGLSFLSLHTIGLELETNRLAMLDVRGLPVMRDWHVARLAAKRLSPPAEAFRRFVLDEGKAIVVEHAGPA